MKTEHVNGNIKSLSKFVKQVKLAAEMKAENQSKLGESILNKTRRTIKSIFKGKQQEANKGDFVFNANNITTQNEFFDEEEDPMERQSIKEILEDTNVEHKFFKLINDTHDILTQKEITDYSKYERDKCILVEKSLYEKMLQDNENLKSTKKQLTEEYDKFKIKFDNVTEELNKLSSHYNNVEMQKADKLNKIYANEFSLKNVLLYNSKLNEMINKEQVAKDNIFRALLEFTKKYNAKLPKELKGIYAKFNEDHFNKPYHIDNSDKISFLENKISSLSKEIKTKTTELENIREKVKINTDNQRDNNTYQKVAISEAI